MFTYSLVFISFDIKDYYEINNKVYDTLILIIFLNTCVKASEKRINFKTSEVVLAEVNAVCYARGYFQSTPFDSLYIHVKTDL